MGKYLTAMVLLVLITIVFSIVSFVGYWVGPRYEFQNEVHSHMENAYYADTPELIIEELEKAKYGMINLGLEKDMYAKFWSWEKTPDWKMDYQYKHIDSIINRTEDVIKWRDDENRSGGEINDVYEQKVQAIRKFIQEEEWSDDIAEGAYMVNYHVWYVIWVPLITIILVILIVVFVILGIYHRND